MAAGTLWRLRRPNGPANLRLKRGYAASNTKTDFEPSIFPEPLRFLHSKKRVARPDRFTAAVACRDGAREAELQREALSLGEARKYQFLRVADVDTHKTSSTHTASRAFNACMMSSHPCAARSGTRGSHL